MLARSSALISQGITMYVAKNAVVLRPKIATNVDQSVMIPGLSIGSVAIKARSHVDYGGSTVKSPIDRFAGLVVKIRLICALN